MVSFSILHRDRPARMIFSSRGISVTQEKRVVLGLECFLVPGLVSYTSKNLARRLVRWRRCDSENDTEFLQPPSPPLGSGHCDQYS